MIGEEVSFTLATNQDQTLFAPIKGDTTPKLGEIGDPAYTLRRGPDGGSIDYVADCGSYIVRRLTPTECERLQGFPDGWTDIEYRGKPAADGPRYKALGNSWAVPCARWVGERIEMVEKLTEVDI